MGIPYAEVIGDPIAHSKSPIIHKFWLGKLGLEGDYRATRVPPGELQDYLESRRFDPDWHGCNVSMPLKERIAPLLDLLDETASATGAVNCVVGERGALGGANNDVWGIFGTLGMFDAKDPVIVVGTGGAARAALYHLQSINAIEVHVMGRDRDKAQGLIDKFDLCGEAWSFADEPDIHFPMRLINATPLGMTGQPPMPDRVLSLVDRVNPDGGVFDMIYDPIETPLLAAARARKLMTANGLAMLVDQARESFQQFFGTRPSVSFDDELFELVTS